VPVQAEADLLHAMDHRRDQAHAIWRSTWAPLLHSRPLATAADWGDVPWLCPWVRSDVDFGLTEPAAASLLPAMPNGVGPARGRSTQ
jgi:hypothetical protein